MRSPDQLFPADRHLPFRDQVCMKYHFPCSSDIGKPSHHPVGVGKRWRKVPVLLHTQTSLFTVASPPYWSLRLLHWYGTPWLCWNCQDMVDRCSIYRYEGPFRSCCGEWLLIHAVIQCREAEKNPVMSARPR